MTTPRLVSDRRSQPSSQAPIALAPVMVEAVSRAHAFAPAATPVILYGESGTGKTFFAEYIHQLSERSGGFHAFSAGTVAPQLVLDELFGHVPGAYTDARKPRPGRFATAGGGTLLLDDIQTIDLGTQKQLLQVLDRRTYSPVGCDRVMTVACRIILAMTESPDALMKNGVLLKDLRYRFGECGIRIPRLAERRDEIPLHAQRALQGCPIQTAVNGPTGFTDAALAFLCACAFDGNVRQLQGIVLRAYLIAGHSGAAQIGVEHFPEECRSDLCYTRHGNPDVNRRAVERALSLTGGNARAAAELLGVSRTTLNAMRGVRLERRTGFR